jgi:histidinol-phosphatase
MKLDTLIERALPVAQTAALAAGSVIANFYRQADVGLRIKGDRTPVTAADEASEAAIRRVIRSAFKTHSIYGEEGGREGDSEVLWLVDPIDGTKAFVREYPVFSTQIALMVDGELVLGVSYASAFGEMAWATRGGGAFLNGRACRLPVRDDFSQVALSTGNLKSLALDPPRWARLATLAASANRTRGYGDFYHYHLLATGGVDCVIESDVNILDIAALVVVIREAGGVFTDLDGQPIDLATRSVLTAGPFAHRHALQTLAAA